MGYFKLYATDQISLAVPKKAYFMNSIMIGSFVDQSGLVFFFDFSFSKSVFVFVSATFADAVLSLDGIRTKTHSLTHTMK